MLFGRRNRIFCACRHLGGGALLRNLSDNFAHSGASLSGQNATKNSSAEEEKIAAEMQADLLAGTLKLDPENDPVLGTTESGVEIKYHNRALTGTWDYDAFMKNYVGSTYSTYGSSNATGLNGYFYVTFGSYNWVIIGRNSNLSWTNITYTNTYSQGEALPSEFVKFASYSTYANVLKTQTETTTDAGSIINSANENGIVNTVSGITRNYSINLKSFSSPKPADEIPVGCVLCICESDAGSSVFGNTDSCYPGSQLATAMTRIYNEIELEANNNIKSVSLNTYGRYNNKLKIYPHSEHVFPLASIGDDKVGYCPSGQNFCIETYLTGTARVGDLGIYWLRTGSGSSATKALANNYASLVESNVATSLKIRPAFVLKIT